MFKFRLAILGLLLSSCSSAPQLKDQELTQRNPTSLDNNGEPTDNSFDSNLETYWENSKEREVAANQAVAEVIRSSIVAQQKVREEMEVASANWDNRAKRIFGDLPRPSYATRDVHRKTNGCYKAQLNVREDISDLLNRQILTSLKDSDSDQRVTPINENRDLGVFAGGSTYDAIVRLSNGHPGNRPDRVADARGFAVKLLTPGSLGSEPLEKMDAGDLNGKTVLDILSINFPTFFMNDPVRYANLNKTALDSASDFKNGTLAKGEEFWSVFVSGEMSALERRLTLYSNGSVIYSPLFQEYFSMVPSRLGPEGTIRAVKYSWVPTACSTGKQSIFESEAKTQWASWTKDRTFQLPPRSPKITRDFPDDYLRLHARERLSKDAFCFDLYFQLYHDQQNTKIEDSMDPWLRSEAERDWWVHQIVPGSLIWRTSPYNIESRNAYLTRIKNKKLAPAIRVARLTLGRLAEQEAQAQSFNNKTCEDLSFNPWNGNIAYHKPLGVVSRMKRKVYNASRRQRHELNGIDGRQTERK